MISYSLMAGTLMSDFLVPESCSNDKMTENFKQSVHTSNLFPFAFHLLTPTLKPFIIFVRGIDPFHFCLHINEWKKDFSIAKQRNNSLSFSNPVSA